MAARAGAITIEIDGSHAIAISQPTVAAEQIGAVALAYGTPRCDTSAGDEL